MKHQFAGGSTFLMALLITGVVHAGAIVPCETLQVVSTPITTPPGNFGTAVQVSGDYMLVRRSPDFPGPNIARIFVYHLGREGWQLHQELLPGGPATEAMDFGAQLAVNGEHTFVSAPNDDQAATDAGAVYHYHFVRDQWELQEKILSPKVDAGSQFGAALAYDGQRLVVGAPVADVFVAGNTGAAYSFIWEGNALVYESEAIPSWPLGFGLEPGDQFGAAIALDGDTVIIGAPLDDELGEYAGAAYVLRHDGFAWFEEQKLLPVGVPPGELGITQFGRNLQLKGDWAMAAQPFSAVQAGRVVPFKREAGRWEMQALLAAPVPIAWGRFGTGVALEVELMLIGAGSLFMPSACYVYELQAEQWEMVQEMPAIEPGSQFGIAVDLQGQTAFVGAPRTTIGDKSTEAVFVFGTVPFDDCNFNSIVDVCDIELGASDDSDRDGIPNECELICPVELAEMLAVRGIAEPNLDSFGNAIAIDDDVAVIHGLVFDGDSTNTVVVYRWTGLSWDQEQIIAPPSYAGSIAVSGDRLVIGSAGTTWPTVTPGAVYVYEFDGSKWLLEQELVSAGIEPQPFFGWDVAILDERIAVGSIIGSVSSTANPGVVEVFELLGATWSHVQTFTGPGQPHGSHFGWSVEMSADRLIVAAPSIPGGGSVYVFRHDRSNWEFEQQLVGSGSPSGCYTSAVALDDDGHAAMCGPCVFQRLGRSWTLQQKLEPEFVLIAQGFGGAVALDENVALVGDNSDSPVSKAYLFAFDGVEWRQRRVFSAADSALTTDAELQVALDDGRVLIGAVLSETAARSGGVVFTTSMLLADLDCSGDVDGFDLATLLGLWGPCVPGTGCPADLNGDGIINGFDLALMLGAWS